MSARGVLCRGQQAFSVYSRTKKAGRIRAFMADAGVRSVLLVGVTDTADSYENIVEHGVADAATSVVASGLGTSTVHRWQHYVAADALALPFPSRSFDLVVSNAVVEHVGDREAQEAFVAEHDRVGRHWVITTPNRAFPVESHTQVVVRHWSPAWRARQEAFTRLLDLEDFRALLPSGSRIVGRRFGPTFTAYSARAGR